MVKKFIMMICLIFTLVLSFNTFVLADDSGGSQDIVAATKSELGDSYDEELLRELMDRYIKNNHLSPAGSDKQSVQNYQYYYESGNNYYGFQSSRYRQLINDFRNSKASSPDDEMSVAKGEVENMLSGLNIAPDIATANTALSGFSGIISVIVGLVIVLITLLTVLVSVCDICYIALPTFREYTQTNQNEKGMSIVNRLISSEAKYAVKTCSMESGKSPIGLYLWKRTVVYALLGLALFILFTGNISIVINIVLKGAGGIADALKSLGGV